MDKIKAFFANKVTQIIAWVVYVVAVVFLFLCGFSADEISNGQVLTIAIVMAVSGLIAFIGSKIKK